MTEKPLRYPTTLFDWGDTVMRDYPEITIPMVEYLHSTGRRIVLATSASISDEDQIHGALARSGLDEYFSRIACFKNTRLQKDRGCC
jgi:hypothetical protein